MITFLIIVISLIGGSLCATGNQEDQENIQDTSATQTTETQADSKKPQWPQPLNWELLAGAKKYYHGMLSSYVILPEHEEKSHKLIEFSHLGPKFLYNPLAPQKVTLNGTPNQDNPLHKSNIILLSEFGGYPLIVLEHQPNCLFKLEDKHTIAQQKIVSTEPFKDAAGNESGGIIACSPYLMVMDTHEKKEHLYIAAALKPHKGNFGEPGSGIGIIKYNYTEEKLDYTDRARLLENRAPKRTYFFENLDVQTGIAKENRACPFDINSPAISVEQGLAALNEHVIFEWDNVLKRLYIGLQVTTRVDAQEHQGAHALAIGRLHNNKLTIDPLINEQSGYQNSPFSVFGAHQQACIHHIKSFYTSTGMLYLIVVGGKGTPEQTANRICAIPLVHHEKKWKETIKQEHNPNRIIDLHEKLLSDSLHGTLASKECLPNLYWEKFRNNHHFLARFIEDPIQEQKDMVLENDQAVAVGAHVPLPNAITSVHLYQDAVYVTISKDGTEDAGGIFHSQPIFDTHGKIAAWTPWQRVNGIFYGVDTISKKGTGTYEVTAFNTDTQQLCTTHWNQKHKTQKESADLSFCISKLFASCGGIQTCIDVPFTHPAIGPEPMSFIIFIGNKKIVLAEVAAYHEQKLIRYPNDYATNYITSSDGTLQSCTPLVIDPSKAVTLEISGGALEQLGILYTAAVYTNGSHAWLVVGGTGGIGVLADRDGNGWNIHEGIRTHFSGLSAALSFHKIGSYSGVKKIIADQDNLYILTHKELSRTHLTPDVIKNKCPEKISLAESNTAIGLFADVGIAGPLALLATSKGIFTNAPYTAVSLQNTQQLAWHKIEIPSMHGQPQKLFFISPTHHENDFGKKGQVYILSGSIHENHSAVHRLFIDNVNADPVGLVPDIDIEGGNMGLFHFNCFKNIFFTDGYHYLVGSLNKSNTPAKLGLIDFLVTRKNPFRNQVFHDISLQTKKAKQVRSIIRSSATGALLVAGDFGLLVHDAQ